GEQFPLKFDMFLYYTWIVAFSLAIFNLLPIAIFDGGRLVKELIDKIFGTEYDPEAQKKLHYLYDPEEPDQHLMTHNITEIISVKRLDPINPERTTPTKGEINLDNFSATAMSFEPIDNYNNDFIDKIHLSQAEEITEGTLIQVEIKYIQDLKAPIKDKVSKWISWTMGSILLASFAISVIKFGKTFFWL
ncbi:MAG: site-2 protease family protein, partial [Spirochaetes bacterium]|nr:site-2 protease family protein [Spirochaetota bacterium]